MRSVLPLVLLLGCASEEESGDDCSSGGEAQVLVLSSISFVRSRSGESIGFDLDETSTPECGVTDFVSPDGQPGIDNSVANLLPALDQTEGAALEPVVKEAINSGGLLVMVQLEDVDDPMNDSCVNVQVQGGVGVPMVGNDGNLLPAQTFDPDPKAPVSRVEGLEIRDGIVQGGPLELSLPFKFLDADVVFEVTEAKILLEHHPDGSYTGMVGGGVPIQALSDLAHSTGISEEVESLLDSVLGISADLDPDPQGNCRRISATMEFDAIEAFFFED